MRDLNIDFMDLYKRTDRRRHQENYLLRRSRNRVMILAGIIPLIVGRPCIRKQMICILPVVLAHLSWCWCYQHQLSV